MGGELLGFTQDESAVSPADQRQASGGVAQLTTAKSAADEQLRWLLGCGTAVKYVRDVRRTTAFSLYVQNKPQRATTPWGDRTCQAESPGYADMVRLSDLRASLQLPVPVGPDEVRSRFAAHPSSPSAHIPSLRLFNVGTESRANFPMRLSLGAFAAAAAAAAAAETASAVAPPPSLSLGIFGTPLARVAALSLAPVPPPGSWRRAAPPLGAPCSSRLVHGVCPNARSCCSSACICARRCSTSCSRSVLRDIASRAIAS
jgi:hypothetical protein